MERRDPGSADMCTKATRDRALDRMAWTRNWYGDLGFKIQVPVPDVNDEEYERRKSLEIPQTLSYRPPSTIVSHARFLIAAGLHDEWYYFRQRYLHQMDWEDAERGYWFWMEASPESPRLGQTWHDLNARVRLPTLEEYVIAWWSLRDSTGAIADHTTGSWTKTRVGTGVFCMQGTRQRVVWFDRPPGDLTAANPVVGGRAVEVIGNAP